jgi:hypothetical protein
MDYRKKFACRAHGQAAVSALRGWQPIAVRRSQRVCMPRSWRGSIGLSSNGCRQLGLLVILAADGRGLPVVPASTSSGVSSTAASTRASFISGYRILARSALGTLVCGLGLGPRRAKLVAAGFSSGSPRGPEAPSHGHFPKKRKRAARVCCGHGQRLRNNAR